MNLQKLFKTDGNLEKDGVIIDYGPNDDLPGSPPIRFRIARAGGANIAHGKCLERLAKPHRRMIQSGHLTNDMAKDIARNAFLETCLLGWENVTLNGKALEFSKDNAELLFKELPELYADLSEQAASSALYREELLEADLGNSGRSLSTDSSKGQ